MNNVAMNGWMGPVEVNETPKMTNNNAIEGSSLPKANVMTKTVGMPGEQRCNGNVLVRHWALKVVTGQRSTGVHVVLKQAAHLDRHWGVAYGHSGTAAHVAVPGVHIVLHHAALTHDKNNVKSIFEPDFF